MGYFSSPDIFMACCFSLFYMIFSPSPFLLLPKTNNKHLSLYDVPPRDWWISIQQPSLLILWMTPYRNIGVSSNFLREAVELDSSVAICFQSYLSPLTQPVYRISLDPIYPANVLFTCSQQSAGMHEQGPGTMNIGSKCELVRTSSGCLDQPSYIFHRIF